MNAPSQDLSTLATCSLLHEPATAHSGTRLYRGRPVLEATLRRIGACRGIGGVAVICWDDQADAARACAAGTGAAVIPHGPRVRLPQVEAIAAALRWHEGWRGGPLGAAPTDAGFFAPTVLAVARAVGAEAVVLVDPGSALLDIDLLEGLLARAMARPTHDYFFSPAPPGLTAAIVRRSLLETLAEAKTHTGARLCYHPDAPALEPLGRDGCLHPVPTVERSLHDFRLSSDRAVRWAESLGDVERLSAEALVARAGPHGPPPSPRELAIEPTTRRHARPIWQPALPEADADPDALRAVVAEALAGCDDLRVTLGGRGDPLLWAHLPAFLADLAQLGVRALHIQTDLLGVGDPPLELLATGGADVVSVNLPAMSADTYRQMMGVDRLAEVLTNIGRHLLAAQRAGQRVPILVPVFVKCRGNLHEMEDWYDQWIRAVGSASLRGPDDVHHFDAPPPGVAVAEMIRSERRPWELRVRADGTLTDNHNRPVGRLGQCTVAQAWHAAHPPQLAAA